MKPPVALFKKKSIKFQLSCMYQRKDVKENIKKNIIKNFLKLIYFIFYLNFKNNTNLRLCVFIAC